MTPTGGPREACGVAAVVAPGPANLLPTTLALLRGLQHRGRDSAGLAWTDAREVGSRRWPGLADEDPEHGGGAEPHRAAIGHVRYATSGGQDIANAQPMVRRSPLGPFAVAHNGQLVAGPSAGRGEDGASDTVAMTRFLAGTTAPTWVDAFRALVSACHGAFAVVLLTPDALLVARDPAGLRPLSMGHLADGSVVVASESAALVDVGARRIEEVAPGEVRQVRLADRSVRRIEARGTSGTRHRCSFETLYFARPDSRLDGSLVHQVRWQLGRALGRCRTPLDVVVPVPETAYSAALGYASARDLPLRHGLVVDSSRGRSFLRPSPAAREEAVRAKLGADPAIVSGRRLAVVDDTIVRGTTMRAVVRSLRAAGAREVHVRIAAPPVLHPCHMGIAFGRYDEIELAAIDPYAYQDVIGADSVSFLTIEQMLATFPARTGYCTACFDGRDPISPVPSPTRRTVAPVAVEP